jgi:hypothetical protein
MTDDEVDKVARVAPRIEDCPVPPQPAAARAVCEYCGKDVWVDTDQPNPYPQLRHVVMCVWCALQHDEIGGEVAHALHDLMQASAETEPEPRKTVEELGYWDGMMFCFYQPFTMPDGHTAEKIDMNQMQIPEGSGITPRDIIEAMTDPRAFVGEADDLGEQFSPIWLPRENE